MKKTIIATLLISSITPNIMAQNLNYSESVRRNNILNQERETFKLILSYVEQKTGRNPKTGGETNVKIYQGVFQNMNTNKKVIVHYAPQIEEIVVFFVEDDGRGNVFYTKEFLSADGVLFNQEKLTQRALYIIKNS